MRSPPTLPPPKKNLERALDEMNIMNNDYDHCIFTIAQLWLTSH